MWWDLYPISGMCFHHPAAVEPCHHTLLCSVYHCCLALNFSVRSIRIFSSFSRSFRANISLGAMFLGGILAQWMAPMMYKWTLAATLPLALARPIAASMLAIMWVVGCMLGLGQSSNTWTRLTGANPQAVLMPHLQHEGCCAWPCMGGSLPDQ